MAIIIPSKNIYSIKSNKVVNNIIREVSVSVYDTEKKTEKINVMWDGKSPLLTNDFIERTAKITEIKIEPEVEFFIVKEKANESGFIEQEITVISDGYIPPKKVKISNPFVTKDPLSPKYYDVYSYVFYYGDGSRTDSTLRFGLTDNLRAYAYVDEPSLYFSGMKSFYFKYFNLEITLEATRKDYKKTENIYKIDGEVKNKFIYEGNELFQNTTKNTSNGFALDEIISNNILAEYSNGKETSTVRCSISDYYDKSGSKEIDISRDGEMTFSVGNLVIPMVFGADGVDRPLSLYKDGSAKVFRVVGTKFIYDGAVWQELTLQEV